MELYYKDLISEEASLEKLVDDLMLVVQGADELVQAAGAALPGNGREAIASRLQRFTESCHRLQRDAKATVVAAGTMLRSHPYSSAGVAFAIGLLIGALANRPESE